MNSSLTSLFTGLLVVTGMTAYATDVIWAPPGGGSTSWNNATNWGGSVPTNNITSDIAVFNQTSAYNFQPALDAFTVQSVNGVRLGGASASALTLSANTGTQTTSGSTPSGSSTMVLGSVAGLAVGQVVTGTGISAGTFITAVDSGTNTITLSRTTGSIGNGLTMTFQSSLRLGTGGITLDAGAGGNATPTITAPIVLGSNQTWTNNQSGKTLTIQGSIFLGSNALTLSGVTGSTISFNGQPTAQNIGGSGSLVIDTDGTVSIGPGSGGRPANQFTGGVTLQKGILSLNGSNTGAGSMGALGTGVLTINGGSFRGQGNSAGKPLTVSSQVWNANFNLVSGNNIHMGSAAITLGTAAGTTRTVSVDSATNTLTIGGAIANGTTANSLAVGGLGTVILTGASTYTGSTTINSGTLQLDGSLASATVNVNNSGTLTGIGTAAGTTNVNTGGALAPGAGIGTLGTGTVNLATDGTLRLEINTQLSTADRLNITGDFNLALTNDSLLTLTQLGTDTALSLGTVFTLADYSGSWNGGLFEYNTAVLADNSTVTLGLNTFLVDYNNGTAFTLTTVPEPSVCVLLGIGLSAMILRRRYTRVAAL